MENGDPIGFGDLLVPESDAALHSVGTRWQCSSFFLTTCVSRLASEFGEFVKRFGLMKQKQVSTERYIRRGGRRRWEVLEVSVASPDESGGLCYQARRVAQLLQLFAKGDAVHARFREC